MTERKDPWKELVDHFNVEMDPDNLEQTIKDLQSRIRQLANDGKYTKVRITYKGNQLVPDVPIGIFLAAEMAGFMMIGPLRAVLLTLGANVFVNVELIHESFERVKEGLSFYQNGDVELAERCYREALTMRPNDVAAHFHLGVLYRVQGKTTESKGHLMQVVEANHPEFSEKAKEILDRMDGIVNPSS